MKLSAVILTKNEENRIEECIKGVSFCDEIIVIDDFSDDKTASIAKERGVRFFTRNLNNDYAEQRNYGLEKAKGEWVFFVDADEIVTNDLKNEIILFLQTKDNIYSAAKFLRKNEFFGKVMNHGEFGRTMITRLGKKSKGKWRRKVHEYWEIKGKKYTFKNTLIHGSPNSLKEYIAKLNRYSNLHAQENDREGKKSSITKIVFYPAAKFFNNYLLKMGFRDGTHGFMNAILMSLHSYLSWSKLWLIQRAK